MWVMVMVIVCGAAVGLQASWVCPNIRDVSCSCDIPHTLRCTGNQSALDIISSSLRALPSAHMVSLLDCSIQGLVHIKEPILNGVSLHGLVISSRVLVSVSENAFDGLRYPLEALGFPNNQLAYVPILAISRLTQLTRLDLSHNRLLTIGSHSFQTLYNVQFLDLSWNRITNISSLAFSDMSRLKTLRLQSNYLSSSVISQLKGFPKLQDLDISSNRLTGPLGPGKFPRLPTLRTLNIAHNQISSIETSAFEGFDSLESLNLEQNMIDVLEDHGFRYLSNLETLNLAHNRIIAFSESSFSHLTNLTSLDLSGNFLRALSTDLLSPLRRLRELRLDGNDISMISADAMRDATHLKTLTLTDNPLNCDCSLVEFAEWLNRTSLEQKSHGNAVCAIPPSLENAFVHDLTVEQFVCNQDDSLSGSGSIPVSGTGVMLQGFDYNGTHVSLLWMVDSAAPYQCGEMFIYEELGAHEVLLETQSLSCNSSTVDNPHFLSITHNVSRLERGHKYRYCITMVELRQKMKYDFQNSLALGCSEIMALKDVSPPRIAAVQTVNSALAFLEVTVESWPPSSVCSGFILVYVNAILKEKTKYFCNVSKYNISGLPTYGQYNVCVIIENSDPQCVSEAARHILPDPYTPFFTLLFLVIFLFGLLIVVMGYEYFRKRGRQPKLQEQCFLATHLEENQTTGYMKLHATTKL